ncbi:NAD(P)-binding protein [Exidia glandulosa HHB12029]|uniref:D-xylose 1-dehydrogenase (NADP(+), D-xylono-1,5-lactone-forming) n=1 Tax=Exidia glandulosa HHB12029 TaxID=1314781 RepID=A0A165M5J8_EXIGL|nr:NAD(P)-binding protein [Exidia glandulosa HHB12029]
MSSEPFTLRWGIVASGWISSVFTKDILVDPKTRGVTDVVHKLVAVGSRDEKKAREFADKFAPNVEGVSTYGDYAGVYNDPNVDAVYIGSPHTHHFVNARDALLAGKHVLCEKPVTVNAAELRTLLALAKEKKKFFMEAMWTRFQPIAAAIKKAAEDARLGDIRVVQADLSGDFDIHNIPLTHRILDPKLGGGALLDLGPYPLVWAIIALYERPQNNRSKPSKITGTMVKTDLTGVDSNTTFVLDFQNIGAQAILSDSINAESPDPPLVIRFAKGQITVPHPIYKPPSFSVKLNGKDEVEQYGPDEFKFEGGGWHFQADEVARSVRDGKIESELWGWDKSLLEMEIFDEVRRQGDYVLPPGVEQVLV